jgi:hypothetical protein
VWSKTQSVEQRLLELIELDRRHSGNSVADLVSRTSPRFIFSSLEVDRIDGELFIDSRRGGVAGLVAAGGVASLMQADGGSAHELRWRHSRGARYRVQLSEGLILNGDVQPSLVNAIYRTPMPKRFTLKLKRDKALAMYYCVEKPCQEKFPRRKTSTCLQPTPA